MVVRVRVQTSRLAVLSNLELGRLRVVVIVAAFQSRGGSYPPLLQQLEVLAVPSHLLAQDLLVLCCLSASVQSQVASFGCP